MNAPPGSAKTYPVTVVGGYLGAGKTTLVNQLLRNANGLRLAVLVNEFGDLPIDADLIEAEDGDLISIAGGCICCSYGSDLMAALMELPERLPNMDAVLVEASGVALPGGIVSALTLLQEYVLDAVVVVADAETITARAADRYVGDTVTRQLADADIVMLNKVDLLPSERIAAIEQWLASEAPQARVMRAVRADVPFDALVGTDMPADATRHVGGKHFESDGFETLELTPEPGLDPEQVGRELASRAAGLLRAKGFLLAADGNMCTVQVVGDRFDISAAPSGVAPGLVCIGVREHVNREIITRALKL